MGWDFYSVVFINYSNWATIKKSFTKLGVTDIRKSGLRTQRNRLSKVKKLKKEIVFFILLNLFCQPAVCQKNENNPRLIILTDIGSDPDDMQSLRRLLLYANEFRIEGLIATACDGPHDMRAPGKSYVFENLIHEAVDDYASVRNNLLLHAPGFPEANELKKVIRSGQVNRGVDHLSPGLSTPASRHIIEKTDATNEHLCIAIWGGGHDLAQALLDVKTTRSKEEQDSFISKLRVYAITDQDGKFHPEGKGTGEWMTSNFPQLYYMESGAFKMNFMGIYRGMYQNDSQDPGGKLYPLTKEGMEQLTTHEWIAENVTKWGALGSGYPAEVNQNPNSERNTQGVKEGDTPSWFYFLQNGLSDYRFPEWGCWGGRFVHMYGNYYMDAQDYHWSGVVDGSLRRKWSVARWREAYQNDFALRMRWCVLPYDRTNHNPIAVVNGDKSRNVIAVHARKGEDVVLDAKDTHDPDGDKLSYNWQIYREISSSPAILENSGKQQALLKIQGNAESGEIHVILEVKDSGTPVGYSYRRVIIRISDM